MTGYRKHNWGLARRRISIPDSATGMPYLERLQIVQTPLFGIQVHAILLADGDRDMHDHPRPFLTVMLRGGYTERVGLVRDGAVTRIRQRTWRRFSMHRVSTDMAHTILSVKPHTLTLVIKGPARREWGFWTDSGFVLYTDYLREDGSALKVAPAARPRPPVNAS